MAKYTCTAKLLDKDNTVWSRVHLIPYEHDPKYPNWASPDSKHVPHYSFETLISLIEEIQHSNLKYYADYGEIIYNNNLKVVYDIYSDYELIMEIVLPD
jgi:hypothetical protein